MCFSIFLLQCLLFEKCSTIIFFCRLKQLEKLIFFFSIEFLRALPSSKTSKGWISSGLIRRGLSFLRREGWSERQEKGISCCFGRKRSLSCCFGRKRSLTCWAVASVREVRCICVKECWDEGLKQVRRVFFCSEFASYTFSFFLLGMEGGQKPS